MIPIAPGKQVSIDDGGAMSKLCTKGGTLDAKLLDRIDRWPDACITETRVARLYPIHQVACVTLSQPGKGHSCICPSRPLGRRRVSLSNRRRARCQLCQLNKIPTIQRKLFYCLMRNRLSHCCTLRVEKRCTRCGNGDRTLHRSCLHVNLQTRALTDHHGNVV